MPPPLNVNREAVQMLAKEIGTRPAARAVGLNEDTVCAWSAKEKWHDLPKPAVTLRPTSSASKSPVVAHAEILAELGGKTRLGLAKGLLTGAEHIAQLDGASILAQAGEVASITKSAASVHSWADHGSAQVRISIHSAPDAVRPCIDVETSVTPSETDT